MIGPKKRRMSFKLRHKNTLLLHSLGDIQLCPGGEQRTHHLDVKAMIISQRLLQRPPVSGRERPVGRLHLLCETFISNSVRVG